MNQFVTIQKIAQLLDCSTKTVLRKVKRGTIPAIQPDGPGTMLRFDVAEVIKSVKQTQPSPEPAPPTSTQTETGDQSEQSKNKLSGPIPRWKRQKQNRKE